MPPRPIRWLALAIVAAAIPRAAFAAGQAATVADEAVDTALALPPGYKRDVVLRAVSRNLRWFGSPEQGTRAARAMINGGVGEIPPGATAGSPGYVPLRTAMPSGGCDAGLWRREAGGEARTPHDREEWAETCLLSRQFEWIGPPPVAIVRAAAAGLPSGKVKAAVLAMLVQSYGDADTLRFVENAIDREGERLPGEAGGALRRMLAAPAVLYRLGRKDDALAAAQRSGSFAERAEIIRLLIAADDIEAASSLFESLGATPPALDATCFGWFGPIDGLGLATMGGASAPVRGIGAFLDRLPASPLFRRVCPTGLEAGQQVEHLLAAGRFEAAVAQARQAKATPFLLIDALLQIGEVELRGGDRAHARSLAEAAGAALPPFNPDRTSGERPGDTRRRFEAIRLLAATGAVADADALAHRQPPGALRAVALSAAVAGRAGLRFDDQAPSLQAIGADDL